jgi:multimeric flavodoxin WrbA
MLVIGFNGSARKDGNTATMIRTLFSDIQSAGIETELIQLAGEKIRGCTACYRCFEKKDQRCVNKNDIVNHCLEKMLLCQGMILASPTYFADVSSEMKALIDRCGMVARANNDMFQRKVGAAVVVARRGGAIHAFDSINHFFFISQMIVPGSNYWNVGIGREKGDVEKDDEGLNTMHTLGQNMAWLLKKLQD